MSSVPNLVIDSDFAKLNGTRLYYEQAGQGSPPLVLLHAGIADRRMWDPQFAPLAQAVRVLRYDMRGHGQSHPQSGEYAHAADLLALLDHLQIERAVLCGCAKGGTAAIDLALAHPQRVAGLGLVGASPTGFAFPAVPPPQWDQLLEAFQCRDFLRAAELDIQLWVDGPRRTPDQVDPAIRERVFEMDLIALANHANGLGSETWLEANAAARIAELDLPVHIFTGELDDPNILHAGHWLAQNIPTAQHTIIPEAARLPNMEKPEVFNQALLEFLASIS